MPPVRGHQNCASAVYPLLAWLCAITTVLSLRYGYYGDHRLVLGPNSSRMLKASSVFVEQVQVRDVEERGVLLYGFSEEPDLRLINWTVSNILHISSYGHGGIRLWLNKGSKVRMDWEVGYGRGENYGDFLVVFIKGEQKFEELKRYSISSFIGAKVTENGNREAEYCIEENDGYYIGVLNLNSHNIVLGFKVDVSSKIHDTSRASSICPITNGLCKAKLLFPKTRYFVLETPNYNGSSVAWYIELSFEARLIAYFILIGVVVVVIYTILEHFAECLSGGTVEYEVVTETEETEPILPRKEVPCSYGTTDEDVVPRLCNSSDDLYDGKICVICYDQMRNCFFTPCGHNATCSTCAQRIMEEESKVCPICRRLVHKIKRLPLG